MPLAVRPRFSAHQRRIAVRARPMRRARGSARQRKPRTILASGLVMSMLLAAVVWSMALNRRRARELSDAKHGLQDEVVSVNDIHDFSKAEESVVRLDTEADGDIAKSSSPAAMIATGVLHNVGNILSGITVSASLIHDQLRQFPLGKLRQVAELIQAQKPGPSALGAGADRMQALPAYLARLSERLEAGQKLLMKEAETLSAYARHASAVVATQQGLAGTGAPLRELVSASALMEEALNLSRSAFATRGVELHQDYAYLGPVNVDRHKVLQILSNLLINAGNALRASPRAREQLWLSSACVNARVRLTVRDDGAGIEAQHLPLLFNFGFTTRQGGHGFGLHLSAHWALELGGSLTCSSEGPGHGASFTLELPAPAENARYTAAVPAAVIAAH